MAHLKTEGIFPAKPHHIKALVALDAACFSADSRENEQAWRAQLANTEVFLVQDKSEQGTGTLKVAAAVVVRGDELYSLAVHPAHRRMGYGVALVRSAIGRGASRLWVREQNRGAEELYMNLSFVRSGKSKVEGKGPDAVRFVEMVLPRHYQERP